MSYDELEDPAYNPFAEDNGYLSESNDLGNGSSSESSKLNNSQLVLSLSTQSSVKGIGGEQGKRSRLVPEISIPPHSAGLHPLKSALATQNDTDLGVTRPHLSRIINEGTLINLKSSEPEDTSTIKVPLAQETEVIVHEVSLSNFFQQVSVFIDLNQYLR